MLKINKNEQINSDYIECISAYDTIPVRQQARLAKERKMVRKIMGRYGYKSMIIMDDAFVFLCPNLPEIYIDRLLKEEYLAIDSKKYFIRKKYIREITSAPNKQQHLEIVQAKKNDTYVNLCGNKGTKYFIFTNTGRIYGIYRSPQEIG